MARISFKKSNATNMVEIENVIGDLYTCIYDMVRYAMIDPEGVYEEDVTLDMAFDIVRTSLLTELDACKDEIEHTLKDSLEKL